MESKQVKVGDRVRSICALRKGLVGTVDGIEGCIFILRWEDGSINTFSREHLELVEAAPQPTPAPSAEDGEYQHRVGERVRFGCHGHVRDGKEATVETLDSGDQTFPIGIVFADGTRETANVYLLKPLDQPSAEWRRLARGTTEGERAIKEGLDEFRAKATQPADPYQALPDIDGKPGTERMVYEKQREADAKAFAALTLTERRARHRRQLTKMLDRGVEGAGTPNWPEQIATPSFEEWPS